MSMPVSKNAKSQRLPKPSQETAPVRELTERQVEAVYSVMRLLRDDEPAQTTPEDIHCDACGRLRSSRGSVVYGTHRLCNGCATDYELLRTSGRVTEIEQFLRLRL